MCYKCCKCHQNNDDNYDYVIERLSHMREEIDYIIQVLEHKRFKDSSKDVLQNLEDELRSYSHDNEFEPVNENSYYCNNYTIPHYKHRHYPVWFY